MESRHLGSQRARRGRRGAGHGPGGERCGLPRTGPAQGDGDEGRCQAACARSRRCERGPDLSPFLPADRLREIGPASHHRRVAAGRASEIGGEDGEAKGGQDGAQVARVRLARAERPRRVDGKRGGQGQGRTASSFGGRRGRPHAVSTPGPQRLGQALALFLARSVQAPARALHRCREARIEAGDAYGVGRGRGHHALPRGFSAGEGC